jgi:hypothetical protein
VRQQPLASQGGFERFGKETRREQFLDEMERVAPWAELEALVRPHYPNGGNGRPPVGLSLMLRIYLLQQWFHLSDPAAEERRTVPEHRCKRGQNTKQPYRHTSQRAINPNRPLGSNAPLCSELPWETYGKYQYRSD